MPAIKPATIGKNVQRISNRVRFNLGGEPICPLKMRVASNHTRLNLSFQVFGHRSYSSVVNLLKLYFVHQGFHQL